MRRLVLALATAGLLSVVSALPAFAVHLPTPNFGHPGQFERCESTNPHNNPGFDVLPDEQEEAQHALWHSECDGVIPNDH